MHAQAVAGLREAHDLLATFRTPSGIHRARELKGTADKISSCAVDLLDDEPEHLRRRLASAVSAVDAAEKAARAHRRNPLTRPISQTLFTLKTGSALGALQLVLDELAAEAEWHQPGHPCC